MRRVPLITTGLVLAVVVGGLVVVGAPGRSGPQAPLPSSSASARTVARAFLDAAVRRDCHGMRALSAPDDTDWCPASLWQQWTGEGDPTMDAWSALQRTTAAADRQQCFEFGTRETGLTGMEPGANTWGLCLRHHADGWRVVSEGVG